MSNIDEKIIFEPTGFEYQNTKAKVVIVGITPGNSQLKGDREGLDLREIKRKNAFAGSMRPNLVNMLDYIGVNRLLGIESCRSLWEEDFDKVDMTSLLKKATYKIRGSRKEMFKDTKDIDRILELRNEFEEGFVKDCEQYNNARLFVACGQGVYDELMKLKKRGVITAPVVAIAHPSGNNGVRVLYYMGQLDSSLVWCTEKAKEAKKIIGSVRRTGE